MVVVAMIHLGNGVSLHEVLVSIPDIINNTKVRLQDRVLVPERGVELELIA